MSTLMYVLEILGCLGVFLFGMKVLSEGIQKTAGDRMRQVMATMTKNRLSGVFTGFLTTTMLQSSSATTVIVVSFVNAGLLTLIESIGVIMGANLGTTVTAWIIAAVGKFSLASWALPIIGVGLPLLFIGKGRAKSLGEVLLGFGLLFFGLGLLKDAVPDVKSLLSSTDPAVLARAEWWRDTIASFSGKGYLSLFFFLGAGVLLTLIVQSSSAAMAITVTLAIRGWIGFDESCAIVLGENIGTTVTAYLASLGANTQAKRAARAHFLFNVLGVLWMLVVFYGFTEVVKYLGAHLPDSFRVGDLKDAGEKGELAWNLAIFHSLFNFTNILVLFAFVPWIAKIVTKWVKDKDEPARRGHLPFISQNLVDVGELNLPEAEKAVMTLGGITSDMFTSYREGVLPGTAGNILETVAELKVQEEDTDSLLHDLTEYLVRCSSAELSPHNAAAVSAMLRITAELEEVADCVFRAGKLGERRTTVGAAITPEMLASLKELAAETSAFLDFASGYLIKPVDDAALQRGRDFEKESDKRRTAIGELAMKQIQDKGNIQVEMLNIDTATELEKINNHLLNILEAGNQRPHKHA